MSHQPGDWVRTHQQGVWQVVRVVPDHYEARYTLDAPLQMAEGPLYVLKRIVSDKWKPAITMGCVEASLVKPLNKADTAKLAKYLQQNADILARFAAYNETLAQVLNLSFTLPKKADFRPFKQAFEQAFAEPLMKGLTSDDIMKIIQRSEYAPYLGEIPRMATLQFRCEDLEVKRKHFIYRALVVHNF